MKLLEYEAKQMLKAYGMTTPEGTLVRGGGDVGKLPAVVKAQIPAGGRGKAGGVRVVRTAEEHEAARRDLLGRELLGHAVGSLLIEELLEAERELYVAVALDRSRGELAILVHPKGGVDINEATREHGPVLRMGLEKRPGRTTAAKVRGHLDIDPRHDAELERVIVGLWELCQAEEALLAEVNPLILTTGGRLVCADAKIELDDAAAFRHPGWKFEAAPTSAQFVVLSDYGTVASVANGAGLAMATNDAIAAAGAEPANFYDVGGGSDVEAMKRGFDRIRGLPNVRAIVVNIFGGITRCDEVAAAIIAARAAHAGTPPLFIRLAGTNAAEGGRMLEEAGLELTPSLGECVERAVAEVRSV